MFFRQCRIQALGHRQSDTLQEIVLLDAMLPLDFGLLAHRQQKSPPILRKYAIDDLDIELKRSVNMSKCQRCPRYPPFDRGLVRSGVFVP